MLLEWFEQNKISLHNLLLWDIRNGVGCETVPSCVYHNNFTSFYGTEPQEHRGFAGALVLYPFGETSGGGVWAGASA